MKNKTTLSIFLGIALCFPVALPEAAFADGRSKVRQPKRSTSSSMRRSTVKRPKPTVRSNRRVHRHKPSVRSNPRVHRSTKIHKHRIKRYPHWHVNHPHHHLHHFHAHYHYGFTDPCYDEFHRSGVFWDIHWQLPVLNVEIYGR